MSNRIQKSNWQKGKEEEKQNKSFFVFLFSGQHGKEEAAASRNRIDPPSSLLSASAHFYLFIIELWEEEHAFLSTPCLCVRAGISSFFLLSDRSTSCTFFFSYSHLPCVFVWFWQRICVCAGR
jgi:hypothetical protein